MSNKELPKNLTEVLNKINKSYGQGTIMSLGDTEPIVHNLLSSGSLLIDKILGGGIGFGRVTEIYGAESSGKTTLALQFAAQCQKNGGRVAYIDVENALDTSYANHLGVNTNDMIFTQPSSGEQALEIADKLVSSGAVDIIVIDSVAALTPQKEIEGEMGDSVMGLQARLMSQALRKLTPIVGKSNCVVVFINQIRMKIGIMFGNPETTTGGNALKFYSSIRLEIRRIESIDGKGDEEAAGNRIRVKIVKNKVAPPFRKVELDLYFGKGISATASILDSAVKHGLVDKKGAWYAYGDEKIGQGKENVVQYFEDHQDFTLAMESKIRSQIFPGQILRTKEGNPISDAERSAIIAELHSRGVGVGAKPKDTEDSKEEPSASSAQTENIPANAEDLATAAGEISTEEAPF